MIYKFIYFEHIGFADILSCDYFLIDGEEYRIFQEKCDFYSMYRGVRLSFYIEGKFFRRYNSEEVGMRIMLNEVTELPIIIEKTKIKWQEVRKILPMPG